MGKDMGVGWDGAGWNEMGGEARGRERGDGREWGGRGRQRE